MQRQIEDKRLEFLNDIIEVFEDFLDEKGIKIENEEKEHAIQEGDDPDVICNIYGTDYGQLSDELDALMCTWGVLERREYLEAEEQKAVPGPSM